MSKNQTPDLPSLYQSFLQNIKCSINDNLFPPFFYLHPSRGRSQNLGFILGSSFSITLYLICQQISHTLLSNYLKSQPFSVPPLLPFDSSSIPPLGYSHGFLAVPVPYTTLVTHKSEGHTQSQDISCYCSVQNPSVALHLVTSKALTVVY